jgi:hypothetical protein
MKRELRFSWKGIKSANVHLLSKLIKIVMPQFLCDRSAARSNQVHAIETVDVIDSQCRFTASDLILRVTLKRVPALTKKHIGAKP